MRPTRQVSGLGVTVFALSFTATIFLIPPPPDDGGFGPRSDPAASFDLSTDRSLPNPSSEAAGSTGRPHDSASWGRAMLDAASTVGGIAADAVEPFSLRATDVAIVQAGMSFGFEVPDALGLTDARSSEPVMTPAPVAPGEPARSYLPGTQPPPTTSSRVQSVTDAAVSTSSLAPMHGEAGTTASSPAPGNGGTLTSIADLRVVRARFDGHDRLRILDEVEIDVDTDALAVLAREVSGGRKPMPGTTVEAVYETRAGAARVVAVRVGYGIGARQAFRYDNVFYGADGFYTRDGRSLDGRLLRYPVTFTSVTSHFSYSRPHPILRRRKPHYGVDFAAPAGTPVIAVGNGTVRSAGWQAAGGTTVHIEHGDGYVSGYAHLQRIASGVKRGETVRKGQVIGYVGATGRATGPHLHFSLSRNGSFLDPMGPSVPSHESLLGLALAEFRGSVVARSEAAWAFAAEARRNTAAYANAPSRSVTTR